MPPRIHRRLRVCVRDDRLLVMPISSTKGVQIEFGVKGKVSAFEGSVSDHVEVGGILGIVRLWDAAYLLVFLAPEKPPFPLFPNHVHRSTEADVHGREAPASSHHVSQLGTIYSIPLSVEKANQALDAIRSEANAASQHTAEPSDPPPDETEDPDPPNAEKTAPTNPATMEPPSRRELEIRIITQIKREFGSGNFFYSHDFDLTRTLQHKRRKLDSRQHSDAALADLLPGAEPAPSPSPSPDDILEPDIQMPLWRRVDRRFFWNEWMLKDFLEAGLHSFILPIMQGWVQSSTFSVPIPRNPLNPTESLGSVPVDLVIISRRSKDRAGLRYQRRGIDSQGHVANMVETEMIVRAKVEDKTSLFSFVQVRGSIPLKWSQSPFSMKPPPTLDQPVDQCFSVAQLHFDDLASRYGHITVVNLSEQTGKEAVVTNGFGEVVKLLDRSDVTYKTFDFHAKCHGMKWEHISELVNDLDFDSMGYLWTLQSDLIREQSGAFRTNCIDCLDRTNVVQSALARRVLTSMLTQLGLTADSSTQIENVFNDVWGNNGDAISQSYAKTSALKGDFVRRGKRDLQGMLHDGISSLSRMFYGAVSDFFAQTVISFMLGHRNLAVFSEFLEALKSTDASSLVQMSRVRAAAVETSAARVITDGEDRVGGWTLLSPEERGVTLSNKLEEKILLLTTVAIYVVSHNIELDKVSSFTRIPLTSISSIQHGAYILSTLQEAARDPQENYGFVIHYSPLDETSRTSTYSMRNKEPMTNDDSTFFAFKILEHEFSEEKDTLNTQTEASYQISPGESSKEASQKIVQLVAKHVSRQQKAELRVDEKDIVSLAEAQRSTSLLSRVDYAVKRFLWL